MRDTPLCRPGAAQVTVRHNERCHFTIQKNGDLRECPWNEDGNSAHCALPVNILLFGGFLVDCELLL